MEKIVVKIGSSSIVNCNGIDKSFVADIARQVAYIRSALGIQTIIVSSGAIAGGKALIPSLTPEIGDKQVAAIFGQPNLINIWSLAFEEQGILVGEALPKDEDLNNLSGPLQKASELGVVVLNGPDATYDPSTEREIISIDNDRLSRYSAQLVGANRLIMLTGEPGILDCNEEVIEEIATLEDLARIVFFDKTELGTGGPGSKVLEARKFITDPHKVAFIAGARTENVIVDIVMGRKIGTKITLPLQGFLNI